MKLKAICSVLLSFVLLAGGTTSCYTKQEFRPDELSKAIMEAGGEGFVFRSQHRNYSPVWYSFDIASPDDMKNMGAVVAAASEVLAKQRREPYSPYYAAVEFKITFYIEDGPEIALSNQKLDEALYFEDSFCTMTLDNQDGRYQLFDNKIYTKYRNPALYMGIDGITDLRIGNVDLSERFFEQISDEALKKSQIRSLRLRLPSEYDEQLAQRKESLAALPEPIVLTSERAYSKKPELPLPDDYPNTRWVCKEYDISFEVDDELNAIGRAIIDGKTTYLDFWFLDDPEFYAKEIPRPTLEGYEETRGSSKFHTVLCGNAKCEYSQFQVIVASTSNSLWEQEERVVTLTFTRSDLPAGSVNFHEETPASE